MSPNDGERRRWAFRARRSRPEEARTYRLANSIRLPFFLGGAALLLTAASTSVLVGRVQSGDVEVPTVVLDYQESVTIAIAQSVRRGVNEGVVDLDQLARTLDDVGLESNSGIERLLADLVDGHGRYRVVYVIDRSGAIVASVGEGSDPRLVAEEAFGGSGIAAPVERSDVPVIPQYAVAPGGDLAVVGHYDHEFMRFAMELARPGEAWVVDDDGRIISASGPFLPFAELPRRSLRDAADSASAGRAGTSQTGGSFDSDEIVSFAPVEGSGPAGQLGWSVVTSRRVPTMSLPEVDARRQGFVAGVIAFALVLGVFGWLWLIVVRPILRLQKEAERLAYGDLSTPVELIRYDEIGLIARALERIRISLVRRKVQGEPEDRGPS